MRRTFQSSARRRSMNVPTDSAISASAPGPVRPNRAGNHETFRLMWVLVLTSTPTQERHGPKDRFDVPRDLEARKLRTQLRRRHQLLRPRVAVRRTLQPLLTAAPAGAPLSAIDRAAIRPVKTQPPRKVPSSERLPCSPPP